MTAINKKPPLHACNEGKHSTMPTRHHPVTEAKFYRNQAQVWALSSERI
jgi:hypothetical protein